jgi:hypothetical protein
VRKVPRLDVEVTKTSLIQMCVSDHIRQFGLACATIVHSCVRAAVWPGILANDRRKLESLLLLAPTRPSGNVKAARDTDSNAKNVCVIATRICSSRSVG